MGWTEWAPRNSSSRDLVFDVPRHQGPGGSMDRTFADPEGNEFDLVATVG